MENSDDQEAVIKFEVSSVKKLVTRLAVLIVVCSIIIASVIMYAPRSEGYNEMYTKVQNQTDNSPTQSHVIDQNSVFDVQVVVVNNKPVLGNYQVQVKIAKDTFSFPVNVPAHKVYEFTLDSKQSWNYQVPVTLGEKGDFSVVFELFAENEGVYRFTDIYCVQHVTVI
ncbi:MAG: hypothetical protein LBB87_06130 [Nitrososphaerota archaeon]|jgi:uncharacterized membrane protein|nr:hypothetical protein [Nitrososphaerota archaeon]